MKKIKRLSLNGLEETQMLLNDVTKASIVGGAAACGGREIAGGTLEERNGGVVYTGNDGSTCFFAGVKLGDGFAVENTAYQLGGVITISKSWTSFNVDDFAHEYGHYLQEQEMGHWNYFWDVAVYSAYDMLVNGGYGHQDLSVEKDATERGKAYLSSHLTKSKEK